MFAENPLWGEVLALLLLLLLYLGFAKALEGAAYVQPLSGIQSLVPAGVDAGPFVLVNTRSSLCIQQANSTSGESTPADSTQLVLLPAGCKDAAPHVQFMFTADGQLKHISSGQCIAPASPVDDENDNPAAVLKPCKGSEGNTSMQWNLTAMGSLQHRQSSKCLHPEGGQPKAGIRIHLYKGCDQDRLEFMPIPPDQVASSLQLPSEKHLEVDIGRKQSIEPAPLCCTAHHCTRRRCRPPRNAFATLIRSGKYLPALQGLICSLAKSNPGSHLIIIAPPGDVDRFTADQYSYLQHNASVPGLSVEYMVVQNVEMPNYMDPRYHLNWIKLQAWNLTDWDALIMLDADMIVVGDLRHLFRLPHHFATVPYQAAGKYNWNSGGFLFLRPCRAVFDHMVSLLLKYRGLQHRHGFAEQTFLRWYFFYDVFNLPLQYNANPFWNTDIGSKGTVTGLQPIVLHFVDKKPWDVPKDDPLYKYANSCGDTFVAHPNVWDAYNDPSCEGQARMTSTRRRWRHTRGLIMRPDEGQQLQ